MLQGLHVKDPCTFSQRILDVQLCVFFLHSFISVDRKKLYKVIRYERNLCFILLLEESLFKTLINVS